MWLRDIHEKDFNEIVDLVWNVWNDKPVYLTRSHLVNLYQRLLSVQQRYWTTFMIQKEDIQQQLSMLWLRYENKYKKISRRGSLLDYLLQCSILGMETWFYRQISVPSYNKSVVQEQIVQEWKAVGFQLDLDFLVKGTDYWPLSILSPYERYLIFLKFKEEKSIVGITYMVQKHREVVSNQLSRILNKLRAYSF